MNKKVLLVLFLAFSVTSQGSPTTIVVNTVPAGVSVICGHEPKGVTPVIFALSDGFYNCELVSEQVGSQKFNIKVNDEKNISIFRNFDEQKKTRFEIIRTPKNNDEKINQIAPRDYTDEAIDYVRTKRGTDIQKTIDRYIPMKNQNSDGGAAITASELAQLKIPMENSQEKAAAQEEAQNKDSTLIWAIPFLWGSAFGLGLGMALFLYLKRKKIRTCRNKKPIYSPDDLGSEEKVLFLLSKLAWIKRRQMISNIHRKTRKPKRFSLENDFTIQLEFSDCKIHLHGSRVRVGHIIEIATDSIDQQQARYLEDIGTQVLTGLPSIYRAELTVDEFELVKKRIGEIEWV